MDNTGNTNDEARFHANIKEAPGGLLMMELAGDLDAGTFGRFEKMLESALDAGHSRIIMDLAGLNYINSAGVGVILAATSRARSAAGDIVLVRPTPKVSDVFDLVGMHKFSHIVDTPDEAGRHFRPQPD